MIRVNASGANPNCCMRWACRPIQKYFSSLMMNSTRLQVDKKTIPCNPN